MTDEQIIKNLKEITDNKIIRNTTCIISLSFLDEILDLINRQKAKIERLEKENDVLKTNYESMCISLPNMAKAERKEAIKEFAEQLCRGRVENNPVVITVKAELKEMTEENTKLYGGTL